MKRFTTPVALVLVGLIFVAVPNALAQKKMMMKTNKVLWGAEDIKWDSLKGAPPGSGVMSALLWGNMDTGPFGAFIKFPPGFKNPLHYHSSAFKAVVLKGAYIYVPEKGEEKRLGPGSYFSYPAMDHHSTRGAEDSETVFYVESNGRFDVVPVEEK